LSVRAGMKALGFPGSCTGLAQRQARQLRAKPRWRRTAQRWSVRHSGRDPAA